MADFEVIFMDSGQGDCTLIVYPDNTLTLIDCGSTKGGSGPDGAFAAIALVLERYLPNNKSTIDNLVLTHPDEDHYNQLRKLTGVTFMHAYFGGDISLYKNKRDGNETYNLLKEMVDKKTASCPKNSISTKPDKKLSRAGVNVTILAANQTGVPGKDSSSYKNRNSIVLLVEYGGGKLFLMGDAFIANEKMIVAGFKKAKVLNQLKKGDDDQVVLKMGHHGSDSSSGAAWVKTISPQILMYSSATKRFSGTGMPKKTHLEATVKLCKLDNMGDINQTYVVFDEDQRKNRGKEFVALGPTNQSIWATCFEAEYKSKNDKYLEHGQTWYYGVSKNKAKEFKPWIGYTGYEDDDDAMDVD